MIQIRCAARPSWRAILALALLLVAAACRPEDTLLAIRSIDVREESFNDVISVESGERWLSGSGRVVSFDPMRQSARSFPTPGLMDPHVLGRAGESLLLLADRSVMVASPDSADLFVVARDVDAIALDSVSGILFEAIAGGEIVARPLDTLLPAWGSAGAGANASAMALSPERDRLYQALLPAPGAGPALHVRDLLSGRTLREIPLDDPIRVLTTTRQGDLIGVGWDDDGSDAFITRLGWTGGALVVKWRSAVEPAADGQRLKLAVSEEGDRIAVVGNAETGLTLFDGETGSTIAIYSGTVHDAIFDGFGHVYLLTGTAVVQVDGPGLSGR